VSTELLDSIAIFVLALLVGVEVISKVPTTLHTPLMSGANSIHGIVLVGAMIIAANSTTWLSYVLAFVAMVFGAANVVGGYMVTDRMLEMFKKKPAAPKPVRAPAREPDRCPVARSTPSSFFAWLIGASLFVWAPPDEQPGYRAGTATSCPPWA